MNEPIRPHAHPCDCPACRGETTCLEGLSLAMVYSPCQEFDGIYPVEEALCHGTLFAELDKPFWGARRLK